MSPFINLNRVMSSSVMGGLLVKCPYLLAKVEELGDITLRREEVSTAAGGRME
jgi:hypothetical protein